MNALSLDLSALVDANGAEAVLRNLASECLRRAHGITFPEWRTAHDAIVGAADSVQRLRLGQPRAEWMHPDLR